MLSKPRASAYLRKWKKKIWKKNLCSKTLIPKDFHQLREMYGIFSERGSIDDSAIIWLLTRLLFGIGSFSSFDQLSKIWITLRQNQSLPTLQATNSLRQLVQALNSLDVHFSVASVLRRFIKHSAISMYAWPWVCLYKSFRITSSRFWILVTALLISAAFLKHGCSSAFRTVAQIL